MNGDCNRIRRWVSIRKFCVNACGKNRSGRSPHATLDKNAILAKAREYKGKIEKSLAAASTN
jgi:hypothetical protein